MVIDRTCFNADMCTEIRKFNHYTERDFPHEGSMTLMDQMSWQSVSATAVYKDRRGEQ